MGSERWQLVRWGRGKRSASFIDLGKTGVFRIYYATAGDADRLVEIRVMKPRRGKRKNRPSSVSSIIDDYPASP